MSLDNKVKPTWHVISIYSTVVANIQLYKNEEESINNNVIHCKIIPFIFSTLLQIAHEKKN